MVRSGLQPCVTSASPPPPERINDPQIPLTRLWRHPPVAFPHRRNFPILRRISALPPKPRPPDPVGDHPQRDNGVVGEGQHQRRRNPLRPPANRTGALPLVPSGHRALTPFLGTNLLRFPQRSFPKHPDGHGKTDRSRPLPPGSPTNPPRDRRDLTALPSMCIYIYYGDGNGRTGLGRGAL
jgi:hypothetical protein